MGEKLALFDLAFDVLQQVGITHLYVSKAYRTQYVETRIFKGPLVSRHKIR